MATLRRKAITKLNAKYVKDNGGPLKYSYPLRRDLYDQAAR